MKIPLLKKLVEIPNATKYLESKNMLFSALEKGNERSKLKEFCVAKMKEESFELTTKKPMSVACLGAYGVGVVGI